LNCDKSRIFRLHNLLTCRPLIKKDVYVVTQKDLNTEQWRAGRDGGFPKWPRKP
jgi:hypothetical protein